jgi:hypothetical protein
MLFVLLPGDWVLIGLGFRETLWLCEPATSSIAALTHESINPSSGCLFAEILS